MHPCGVSRPLRRAWLCHDVSGIAEQSHRLLAPLRDLFAATFFSFLDCRSIPPPCPPRSRSRWDWVSSPLAQKLPPDIGQPSEPVSINKEACARGWHWLHAVSSRL